MRVAFWNIRGFHLPLKQKGVEDLATKKEISLLAVLETKLSIAGLEAFMRRRFRGWKQVNNFASHGGGRILILYDPLKIQLDTLEVLPQIIHCRVICKVSSESFLGSFVYGFHSIVARRSLWENLKHWGGYSDGAVAADGGFQQYPEAGGAGGWCGGVTLPDV